MLDAQCKMSISSFLIYLVKMCRCVLMLIYVKIVSMLNLLYPFPFTPFRPEPVIWTKDGGELPDVERMIVEGRELVITSLNKTDNGTYRCEASNSLGTDIAEYKLYVYGECPNLCCWP